MKPKKTVKTELQFYTRKKNYFISENGIELGGPTAPKEGDGVSRRYLSHRWGLGGCQVVPQQSHLDNKGSTFHDRSYVLTGGIYMASNVDDSCKVWNCKIVPEAEDEEEEDDRGTFLRKCYSTG